MEKSRLKPVFDSISTTAYKYGYKSKLKIRVYKNPFGDIYSVCFTKNYGKFQIRGLTLSEKELEKASENPDKLKKICKRVEETLKPCDEKSYV